MFQSCFMIAFVFKKMCFFPSGQTSDQSEDMDSETEDINPNMLGTYLNQRRHTVGLGDTCHEIPDNLRINWPLPPQLMGATGGENPNGTMRGGTPPHIRMGGINLNLPQNLPHIPGSHNQEQQLIYKVRLFFVILIRPHFQILV